MILILTGLLLLSTLWGRRALLLVTSAALRLSLVARATLRSVGSLLIARLGLRKASRLSRHDLQILFELTTVGMVASNRWLYYIHVCTQYSIVIRTECQGT